MKPFTALAVLYGLYLCLSVGAADPRESATRPVPVAPKPSIMMALSLQETRHALWTSPVPFPEGMTRYPHATYTQTIVVRDGRDSIRRFPIRGLLRKWRFSGGLMDVGGWRSDKFRYLPSAPYSWVGDIQVKNSYGYFQPNRGIKRKYPDGTRFDDVLYNEQDQVFEHRTRQKMDGKWTSEVLYMNVTARPQGYNGLTVDCASCHNEAGTGEYGAGLVPGGDTVLSDDLDWSVLGQ